MARVMTRFPNVFVGHPFAGHFPVKKFRKIFKELPFKVIYGNTDRAGPGNLHRTISGISA